MGAPMSRGVRGEIALCNRSPRIPDWAARPATAPYTVFWDPQSPNLYGYVRNNPLSRSDPDGHDAIAIAAELSGPLIECPICEGFSGQLPWG